MNSQRTRASKFSTAIHKIIENRTHDLHAVQ